MDKIIAKAEIDTCSTGDKFFRLTSNGIEYESFTFHAERKIIEALNLKPSDEVMITFEVYKRGEEQKKTIPESGVLGPSGEVDDTFSERFSRNDKWDDDEGAEVGIF